jgi:proline iminopeptidase
MKFFIDDLEAIRKEFRISKMNLLAHSWGAVLAVHYALAYPDHVKKMILSNPAMLSREFDQEAARLAKAKTTAEDSIRRAELMATGMREVKNYEDFFLLSFKASAYDPRNLNKINLGLPADFPEASRALFGGLMKDPATQRDLYVDLAKLQMPVLIIHGEADIVPPASIEKLRQNIPNVSYEPFPKSGHFPFVEETQKFNDVVKRFFSGSKQKKKKASR